MWPLNFLSAGKDRPNRDDRPLNLETLEDRCLLNGSPIITPFSMGAPALVRPAVDSPPPASSLPPPSSIFEAASTLFFDGVELGIGRANQYFNIPEIYAYPVPVSALNESIAFYSPYGGPWAPVFVLAGELVGAGVQYQLQLNSLKTF